MYDRAKISQKQFSELKRIIEQYFGKNPNISMEIIAKSKKNQQQDYIKASFLKKEIDLTNLEIDDLINKQLLKTLSKKEGRLTSTFKAILMVNYNVINPEKSVNLLLCDLNKKFFEDILKLSEEPMTGKEKAISLALLGIGAISPLYPLELNERNEEFLKGSVDLAASFIKNLGDDFDDGSIIKLWTRNVIGETPVRAEMRRLNTIEPHTEGIYRKEGNNKHYLQLIDKSELDQESILYLLLRVFDKRPLTFDEKKKLIATLTEIQQYEFKIIKKGSPYNRYEIKNQIKRIIESKI